MSFRRSLFIANTAEEPPIQQLLKGGNKFEVLRRMSGYSRHIILLGIILIAGLWLFVLQQINNDYDRSIDEASRETMNMAIAFEEHVRKIFSEADKDLIALKESYERGSLSDPAFIATALNAANDFTRSLVAVYNEQGTVIASFIQEALGAKRPDREYFLVHRDNKNQKLYIGKPITGIIDGMNIIPLTRRINKSDGSFGGIVYIGLKSDYFLNFYQKMNLGENQLITLAGLDGIVRARQSGDNLETGQDLTNSTLWRNIQNSPNGTYIANITVDKISRVLSYRVMPDYPLAFVIGKSTKVALANFEKRKKNYIFAASLLSFCVMFLCILLVSRIEKQRTVNLELERRVGERTQELQARERELSEINQRLIETNAAVQQERDRLSSLINSMSDEVWFADTEKRLILVNPMTPQEFYSAVSAATNIEELFASMGVLRPDGSLRPMEESPTLRALQGEVIRNQQEIGQSSAIGEYRYREVNANPVKGPDGKIIGAVAVARDITERKAMEDELARYRDHLENLVAERTRGLEIANVKLAEQAQLLDVATDYIIVRDLDNRIIYWNHAAEKAHGFTADEVKGQISHELLQTQFPIPLEDIMNIIFVNAGDKM